ncbi:MAG TPA: serine hydrolase domain-containing protein [Streptosporangiaceae bacterium]|jgi:CubicO group peptidase (beta-lactamase class C family)
MSDDGQIEIHGSCAAGYEPVQAAFAANFTRPGEIGASVAVVSHGTPVVKLWAGWADPARTRPWQEDTLTNVWSTTKAMTSLCALKLVEAGELDPDAPVARYWPEFAAGGKGDIPVRWIMGHQSGLSGLAVPAVVSDFYDWDKVTALLAAQAPLFPPGTATGYQAMTFGFLVGEVLRRITGRTVREFFATEIAGPLHADFHIGITAADLGRCSQLRGIELSQEQESEMARAFASGHPAATAALANPPLSGLEANDDDWRMAELPAANGHGTALALATVLGAVADGSGRVISARTMERARTSQGRFTDLVLGLPLEFGLGMALSAADGHFGPNPRAFGHDGFGGSTACADPEAGLGFGYVMNRMGVTLADDTRKMNLLAALYTCHPA